MPSDTPGRDGWRERMSCPTIFLQPETSGESQILYGQQKRTSGMLPTKIAPPFFVRLSRISLGKLLIQR